VSLRHDLWGGVGLAALLLMAPVVSAQDSAELAEIVEDELAETADEVAPKPEDPDEPPPDLPPRLEELESAEAEPAPEPAAEPDSSDLDPEPESGAERESGAEPESDPEPVPEQVEPEPAERPGLWAPPRPNATAYDWLQMNSGEWLKGDFLGLRDWRVRFDSDEFDELNLDWENVTSFYLPRPHSYRVEGRILFGTAELRGSVLRIRTGDEVFEFTKADLDSVARGSGGELDYWSFQLGASLAARDGNTQQLDASGLAVLRRETALTRFKTDYRGIYSKSDGDKQTNNHRVNSAFDYFITRRTYLTVPFVEYFADEFQNLDARVSPGVSIGYEAVRNSVVEWDVSIGGAYQYTLLSSEVDEARTSHDFAIVARTGLELDITNDIDLDTAYRLQLVATDFGKTSHHTESTLSFEVWGPVDFDVSFIWDRIEEPAGEEEDDGDIDTPKKDDFRLLMGLTLDF
jgi:hypothetical protein